MHFDAEELGLVGSRVFVEHAPVALRSSVLMVNLDMVGRLRCRPLIVDASAMPRRVRALIDSVMAGAKLRTVYSAATADRSDHASFRSARVPAVPPFTGSHGDYHKATDIVARLDVPGIQHVMDIAEELARLGGSSGDPVGTQWTVSSYFYYHSITDRRRHRNRCPDDGVGRAMARGLCVVGVLLVLSQSAGGQASARALDDTQARLVLRFLRAVASGSTAVPLADSVLAARGTALIMAQQNVTRRVTADEYREVLRSLAEHRDPRFETPAADARSAKGRDGLLRDVRPSLEWGARHKDLLSERLSAISAMDVQSAAQRLAQMNLPAPVPMKTPLFLVMGGRAGAAASREGIYYDVLTTAYRDSTHPPSPAEVVEFFAHELHHVGLDQTLRRRQSALRLDDYGRRAFEFLTGLVMEGSASYLINGHRDLASMRRSPAFAAPGADEERMRGVENMLTGLLEQHWTKQQYDDATAEWSGNALHMTGAVMLDAIWHHSGRAGVMAVLADPRLLLERYNRSVERSATYRFPVKLTRRVSTLGGEVSR